MSDLSDYLTGFVPAEYLSEVIARVGIEIATAVEPREAELRGLRIELARMEQDLEQESGRANTNQHGLNRARNLARTRLHHQEAAIAYLRHVHLDTLANTVRSMFADVRGHRNKVSAPDTLEALQHDRDTALKLLGQALGELPGSFTEAARTVIDELLNLRQELHDAEAAKESAGNRWIAAIEELTHLQMNAEAHVHRILDEAHDDYYATVQLIDAEFDGYPTDGTPREIAIWNHIDNIDGSRVNPRYLHRKLASTKAKLKTARQDLRDYRRLLREARS